jgi:hypothetical protein
LLQDLEGRVSPESVAIAMGPFPFSLSGADFRSTTKSISVTIDGLEGFARAISIQDTSKRFKDLNGRYHVIALALAKDCLSLFGILSAKDAADIPIDRVQIFGTALRVELYTAEPPTAPAAAPKQDELLLLGDERRRAEEQRQ